MTRDSAKWRLRAAVSGSGGAAAVGRSEPVWMPARARFAQVGASSCRQSRRTARTIYHGMRIQAQNDEEKRELRHFDEIRPMAVNG